MSDATESFQNGSETSPPRVQFSLQTLLTLPVVVAFSIVLLEQFQIFGLLMIFVAALVLQFAPVGDRRSQARRLAVDLAWGVVMPILCLVYDPGLVRQPGGLGLFGCFLIAIEILVLLIWLLVGERQRWLAGLLCGALAMGVLTAVVIGVLMVPFSLIGLVVGVGVLGLTPWMTAAVFWRNARQAYAHWDRNSNGESPLLVLLGFVLALALANGLYVLLGDAFSAWLQSVKWPNP